MIRLGLSALLILLAGCGQAAPTGVTLTLATAESNGDCLAAGLMPVRVVRNGDAMEFITLGNGQPMTVVWPAGFAARVVDGVAKLYASDGEEIATEGDVLRGLGGAEDPAGSKFFVCSIGQRTYGSEPA